MKFAPRRFGRNALFASALALSVGIFSAAFVWAQGDGHAEAIQYEPPPSDAARLNDRVSRLGRAMAAAKETMAFDQAHGNLPGLLAALKIPVSSQVLVFSKTSLQHQNISPWTPRAIYFNDDVYVGSVPDGQFLEISAVEPTIGAVFYTQSHRRGASPRLVTGVECVQCHVTPATMNIPGHIMRSVFTSADGRLAPRVRSFLTDDRSPFEERWGGWYVSGTMAGSLHMGNTWLRTGQDEAAFDRRAGSAISRVPARVRTSKYLSSESDIVALMVLGHQVTMHNLFARLHRTAASGLPVATAIEDVVRYALFVSEAPIKGPIKGTTSFAADFEALGAKDAKGRSLRQFDLERRMFRYPCSYLIYSDAFQTLPDGIKDQVYARLVTILSGRDTDEAFSHLTAEDRTAIAEILAATDQGFAEAQKRG